MTDLYRSCSNPASLSFSQTHQPTTPSQHDFRCAAGRVLQRSRGVSLPAGRRIPLHKRQHGKVCIKSGPIQQQNPTHIHPPAHSQVNVPVRPIIQQWALIELSSFCILFFFQSICRFLAASNAQLKRSADDNDSDWNLSENRNT